MTEVVDALAFGMAMAKLLITIKAAISKPKTFLYIFSFLLYFSLQQ